VRSSLECNEDVHRGEARALREAGVRSFTVLFIDNLNVGSYLRDTIWRSTRSTPRRGDPRDLPAPPPGDPPTLDTAKNLFNNLFFNPERYDLSPGRPLEAELQVRAIDEALDNRVLTKRDILDTVKYLIELKNGRGTIDDIDHLGNRRVRAVGELLENQYRIGLVRMERAIKERMSMSQEIETLMPHDLINAKPVSAVVKEFFGSSQLSQFMDQTNPLSEVTHKRRLSALGPGGLTRERAGFEVRDVHPTHYGRICPIETPEGPNIGLIASLSTYARVNEYGFVETPYRKVERGQGHRRGPLSSPRSRRRGTTSPRPTRSLDGRERPLDANLVSRPATTATSSWSAETRSTLMDVSPNQLVSVAAALIPFLEHDDANRALMGSNMQRQAVPLVRTRRAARRHGHRGQGRPRLRGVPPVAKRDGIVDSVDATRIVIRADGAEGAFPDIYRLGKFALQPEHLHQPEADRPRGRRVKAGRRHRRRPVDRDGRARPRSELRRRVHALGWLQLRGLHPHQRADRQGGHLHLGAHRGVRVHRATPKLGKEEITRDIPNVGEEALKDLDDSGIIRIGAEVRSGDILVGKITPKGETQLSPEEKLLRAIFGEKAGDVRDTSLRVPPGVSGVVINARVFSRKGTEKDDRAREIEDQERAKLEKDMADEIKIIRESAYDRVRRCSSARPPRPSSSTTRARCSWREGQKIAAAELDPIPKKYWKDIEVDKGRETIRTILEQLDEQSGAIETLFQEKIAKLSKGDELPPGVIKMVKVYIAIKRKLQPGDKMAGSPRQQGRGQPDPPRGGHALPRGRDAGRRLPQPPRRAEPHERGADPRDHLGWAGLLLGKQIEELVREYGVRGADLRGHLEKIFPNGESREKVDTTPDEELPALALRLKDGVKLATPVFDGAQESEIKNLLRVVQDAAKQFEMRSPLYHVGSMQTGQTVLFDGKTGEAFHRDVTVGVMYVLKLHHLVDDKIHARSIGPYSLVTQQPLGGKAQFGGQRLGEMEVWAMEAYGAAYALQEFLTVKSDDVQGRTRMYESIVKGDYALDAGLPESFNVLMKELQALCLNIELIEGPGSRDDALVAEEE
jgi:DNA-directed RNA polymerase subunit beta